MKVLHLINGLLPGGAEATLYKLIKMTPREECESVVVSMTGAGTYGPLLSRLQVRVRTLDLKRGRLRPGGIANLLRLVRDERPDLIQTWLYYSDILGGLVGKLCGNIPAVWNVRHGNLDPRLNARSILTAAKVCSWLSSIVPRKVVYCSRASMAMHTLYGYMPGNAVVIPNGFDMTEFNSNESSRREIRAELGISENTILIGRIGRFDSQKDYPTFIRAAELVSRRAQNAHFVFAGTRMDWANQELRQWLGEHHIEKRCTLLGYRCDIPALLAALDMCVSSSEGEGFPNIVGEAMACRVPCVVTDVGDSAWVLGDDRYVVPSRDALALAGRICDLIDAGAEYRHQLGVRARSRIGANFSLANSVSQYHALYRAVVKQ